MSNSFPPNTDLSLVMYDIYEESNIFLIVVSNDVDVILSYWIGNNFVHNSIPWYLRFENISDGISNVLFSQLWQSLCGYEHVYVNTSFSICLSMTPSILYLFEALYLIRSISSGVLFCHVLLSDSLNFWRTRSFLAATSSPYFSRFTWRIFSFIWSDRKGFSTPYLSRLVCLVFSLTGSDWIAFSTPYLSRLVFLDFSLNSFVCV